MARLTNKNRLSITNPELIKEWDFDKNYPLTPEDVSCGSGRRAWWLCTACHHSWVTPVKNRAKKGNSRGCPACSGWVVSDKNRLSITHPFLALEWCAEKNFPLLPEDVSFGSNKTVWWVCKKCGYYWESIIANRSNNGNGCPACYGKAVTNKNRLSLTHPELCREWDYEKNIAGSIKNNRHPKTPKDISFGSGKKVWWKCAAGHSWSALVRSRTDSNTPTGCHRCSMGNVSEASQKWLDSLGIPTENREVSLPGLGMRVDAYDPETNTVFEFLGDYWHGNPNIYCSEDVNRNNKKTFGQLFDETAERLFLLRRSGYNLNIIWEEDFVRNGNR